MSIGEIILVIGVLILFIYLVRVGGSVMKEEKRLKRKLNSYPSADPKKKRVEYDDTESFYH